MQFLRTLFWVVVAVVVTLFGYKNWVPVTINLWSDIVVDTWLSLIMGLCFLLGLLPVALTFQASRWRLRRQLHQAERALAAAEARQATEVDGQGVRFAVDHDRAPESPNPASLGHASFSPAPLAMARPLPLPTAGAADVSEPPAPQASTAPLETDALTSKRML